jgi:hypothetical protein
MQRKNQLQFINLTQFKQSDMQEEKPIQTEIDRVVKNIRLYLNESRKKPRYEDKETSMSPILVQEKEQQTINLVEEEFLSDEEDEKEPFLSDEETVSDEEFQEEDFPDHQPDSCGFELPSPPKSAIVSKNDVILLSDDDEEITQIQTQYSLTCDEMLYSSEEELFECFSEEEVSAVYGHPNVEDETESLCPPDHQPDSFL